MTKSKRKEALITLAIILFVSAGAFFYGKYLGSPVTKIVAPSTHTDPVSVPILKQYKDDSGISHAVIDDAINVYAKKEALKQASPLLLYIDSLAEALKIKDRQILSFMQVQSVTHYDSTGFLKKQVDSLKRIVFYYKDKYLKLTVRTGNPSDTLDKGSFDFSYNAILKIAQYYKRDKVNVFGLSLPIGSKHAYADISSEDSNTTIMGVKKYTVAQQLNGYGLRFSLRTGAGVPTYFSGKNEHPKWFDLKNIGFNAGLEARYDSKRSSFSVGEIYSTRLKALSTNVGYRWDFKQF